MNQPSSQLFETVSAAVIEMLAGWPEPLPAVAGVVAQLAVALTPGAAIATVGILPLCWWFRRQERRDAALEKIRDRLLLESLEPDSREGVLRRREEEADRERRAQELLRQETCRRRS
jgi:hypothetical protein